MTSLTPDSCPFCGSFDVIVEFRDSGTLTGYRATCMNCKVGQAGVLYPTEEASILAWNHRAPARMWQSSHDDSVLIGKIRAGTPVPALDTADYIGRQVAAGTRKGDIAKHLNRSAAFVSQHFKLLSLPAPIARALEFGIINDITVVSDLTVVYEFSPSLVTKWLSDRDQDISRSAVKELKTTSGYEAWRKTA